MSKLTDSMNKWMDEVKKDLISNYDKKRFRASGDFERQLQSVVTESKAVLYGAKQSYWMENGRQPNKDQSKLIGFALWAGKSFIAQWVKDKGLNLNPIGVAYNIGKKGYSVSDRPNVISEVLNDNKINELRDMIQVYFLDKVKSDVLKKI
jgi:hypothetical protein